MITRDQFEAHVRAEAAKAYPFASAVGSMLSSRAIHRLEEFDDKAELRREAYIAARMEHEWPLVEALQNIEAGTPPDDWEYYQAGGYYMGFGKYGDPDFVDEPDTSNPEDMHEHGIIVGMWSCAKTARAVLSPYTTDLLSKP